MGVKLTEISMTIAFCTKLETSMNKFNNFKCNNSTSTYFTCWGIDKRKISKMKRGYLYKCVRLRYIGCRYAIEITLRWLLAYISGINEFTLLQSWKEGWKWFSSWNWFSIPTLTFYFLQINIKWVETCLIEEADCFWISLIIVSSGISQ